MRLCAKCFDMEKIVKKLTENLNKKQKNLLLRIIAAAVMLVMLHFLPVDAYPVLRFLLL